MADRVVQILIESSVEGTAEIRQATAATEDLAKAEAKAEEAAGDAGEAFGKTGETAGKLSGAIGMVNPALGEMVASIADLADVGEVASGSLGAIEGAAGMLTGGIGLLVVALGAVVAAVYDWNKASEAANKTLEKQKALTEQQIAQDKALADAKLKVMLLNGEISQAEYGAMSASESADQLFSARKKALVDDLQAEKAALDEAERAQIRYQASRELDEGSRYRRGSTTNQQELTNRSEEIQQRKAKIQELTTALGDQVKQEQDYIQILIENDRLEGEAGDTTATTTTAIENKTDAMKASIAAMDEDSKAKAAYMAMLEKLKSAEDAARMATLSGAEAITAKHAEELRGLEEVYQQTIQAAAADQDRAAANSQYEATLSAVRARQAEELAKFHADESARIEAERQQAIQAELDKANAARQAKIDQIQGGLGALQGGMGGVLNAAGPIGAIINMVIQLVTSIVDEAGNGLIDQVHNMMMEFFNDLSGLGPELADSMIRSVEEGIPALMNGISGLIEGLLSPESIQKILVGSLEMLPMMIGGIIELLIVRIPEVAAEFVKTILSPETWIEAGRMLVQGMTENFKGSSLFGQDATFGRTALAVLTGGLSSFVGSFDQTTDYVPKTGLALVHEGEKISRGRGRTPMGGDTIVQFGGGMVLGTADDIARKIAEQLSGRNIGFGARY